MKGPKQFDVLFLPPGFYLYRIILHRVSSLTQGTFFFTGPKFLPR
jgi:hypothetical protein